MNSPVYGALATLQVAAPPLYPPFGFAFLVDDDGEIVRDDELYYPVEAVL